MSPHTRRSFIQLSAAALGVTITGCLRSEGPSQSNITQEESTNTSQKRRSNCTTTPSVAAQTDFIFENSDDQQHTINLGVRLTDSAESQYSFEKTIQLASGERKRLREGVFEQTGTYKVTASTSDQIVNEKIEIPNEEKANRIIVEIGVSRGGDIGVNVIHGDSGEKKPYCKNTT